MDPPIFKQKSPQTFNSLKGCNLETPQTDKNINYYQFTLPQGPSIRIYILTQSIVRIRVTFDKSKQFKEESYGLVLTGWEDRFDKVLSSHRKKIDPITNVKFEQKWSEQGKYYYFETGELIFKIYQHPYGIQILNKSGTILYKDLQGRACKQDIQGRIYHYSEYNPQTDYFYGFGQTTGPLNKSQTRIRLAPQDSLGYNAANTQPLYKHIPFYLKINKKDKHAIGLFYNNSYECTFDMGNERSGYWSRYCYYTADGGDIDLFVINGPSIKKVVQRYSDLTGKCAMAPRASLGYLGSTMYYVQLEEKCDEAILQFVKKCKKQLIPISNFHLSSGYTVSTQTPKRYVLTWSYRRFADPKAFFSQMNELGVSVSPNVKPGILLSHPRYSQFAAQDIFIKNPLKYSEPYVDRWWGGQGSFTDFTNPKTRSVWKEQLKKNLISKGTTSIWNDNNQYQSIDDRSAICSHEYESVKKGFGIVDQLKTQQSLLMSHATEQAIQQLHPQIRPYIITRAGCAGIQRYASSWSGDNFTSWQTLKSNIPTVLNLGLSGFPNYGSDIGGFWGPAPTPQLLLRWIQNGIFQPRFSIHSCNSDNTVTQPWMFPQIKQLVSKTIRFRYSLLPYLYSLLYFSHIKGNPIARPLLYDFQNSDFEKCKQQNQNFMFGPYILVSNILEPLQELSPQQTTQNTYNISFPLLNHQISNSLELNFKQQKLLHPITSQSFSISTQNKIKKNMNNHQQYRFKKIYLPKGCNWYNWNGRQKFNGGSQVQVKIGLDSIPIFVKDKSIIPLALNFGNLGKFQANDMNKQKVTGMYVKIAYDSDNDENLPFGKKSLQFLMFEDNGTSKLMNPIQSQEQPLDLGKYKRTLQNKLNPKISPNASYLLTKFSIRNSQKDENSTINPNMISISISRNGNLSNPEISQVQILILEIKSIDKCPLWISINGCKCQHFLECSDWRKWKQGNNKDNLDGDGAWYYDHEKGAAILRIAGWVIRPSQQDIQKLRNIEIEVCKDKMILFSKEYEQIKKQSKSQ